MSLVSSLIPLCLKPHCDSLSCELSNLILRLLMLKYIIISDVSEDFTVLITALNQIGNPLLIIQAVLQFAAAVLGRGEVSFCPGLALYEPGEEHKAPHARARCRRRRASGEAAAPCLLLFIPCWFV